MRRRLIWFARTALTVATSGLAGCGTYSTVSERRPHFVPRPAGRGVLARAEGEIAKALREARRKPDGALDEFLDAAMTAEQQLQRNPQDAEAKRDYNFAVGRIVEIIREAKL